jgi:hypothetical protein
MISIRINLININQLIFSQNKLNLLKIKSMNPSNSYYNSAFADHGHQSWL